MPEYALSRQQQIDILSEALRGFEPALAAWLGGSDASGRTDEFSDIDIQAIVPDNEVEAAFAAIHAALQARAPIAHRYRFPEPTWHGHSQEILAMEGADPDHFIDLVIMKQSTPDRLLEIERHGRPMVIFDKGGHLLPPPLDWPAHRAKVLKRLETLSAQFEMLQALPAKAVKRGLPVEAAASYQSLCYRPLIDLLRIRHCPLRFDYGLRYLDRDLPDAWRRELEDLALPASLEEVDLCRLRVAELFLGELAALERGEWSVPEEQPLDR